MSPNPTRSFLPMACLAIAGSAAAQCPSSVFGPAVAASYPHEQIWDHLAVDFDGDGDTDLVSFGFNSVGLSWHENDGAGNFSLGAKWDSVQVISDIALADVDGDGDEDLLLTTPADTGDVYFHERVGLEFLPPVSLGVGPLGDPQFLKGPAALTIEDFNQDGLLEIAVGHLGGITMLEQTAPQSTSWTSGVQLTVASPGELPEVLVTADFNGDGWADLLAPMDSGPASGLFLGDPASPTGFSSPTTFTCADETNNASLGDLDGDGDLDFATSTPEDGVDGAVSLYYNNGLGLSFTRVAVPGQAFEENRDVELADVNADGRLDVAVMVGTGLNSAWVYTQAADGTFSTSLLIKHPVPGEPGSLSFSDLDGDSDLDMVAASQFSAPVVPKVYVLRSLCNDEPCSSAGVSAIGSPANVDTYEATGDPVLGADWTAVVDTNSQPAATVAVAAFSLSNAICGSPGACPLVGGDSLIDPTGLFLSLTSAPTGGAASFSVPIPDNSALCGVELFTQAVVVDPTVSALLVFTNSLVLSLGE